MEYSLIIGQDGDKMGDSFDTVALLRAMRRGNEDEDIFVEKSNGKRVVIHKDDDVSDVAGYLMILKPNRDIAINPAHIISIITKGDL